MEREPCLWMQTGTDTEPLRSRTVMVNGRPVKHRYPQRGHQGDYDDLRPATGIRFVYMVRHDGNVVAHTLTNAASHLDHTTPWGQYQMQQARFLGWFNPGQCPCALRETGDLKMHHLVSEEARTGKPCAMGTYGWAEPHVFDDNCPHSKAERAARQARHAEEQLEIERSYKAKELLVAENQSKTIDLLAKLVEQGANKPETPAKGK
jgi:hypothetical protein